MLDNEQVNELAELSLEDLAAILQSGDERRVTAVLSSGKSTWSQVFRPHGEGTRNAGLVGYCGFLRAKRFEYDHALYHALVWNDAYCVPPLPRDEVERTISRFWVTWAQGTIPDATPGITPAGAWEIWDWDRMLTEEQNLGAQQWLVDKVFAVGGLHYLSSPPGTGKTWVMLDLMRAALDGGQWLGEFDIPQTPVMYIDEEMGLRKLMGRLRRLGLKSGAGLTYTNRVGVRMDTMIDTKRVLDHCQATGTRLVLIDSLVRIHGLDESDNSQMRMLFERFKFLLEADIAVVIAHHDRKGGTAGGIAHEGMRGAAEIVAAADAAYSLSRVDKGQYRIQTTKGRLVGEDEALDVTFEIADDGGQTRIRTVDKDARAAVAAKAIQDELLEAIESGQGLGINVLAKQLGKRKATLQDVLQQMLGDGLITSQRGPNASVLYYPRGLI